MTAELEKAYGYLSPTARVADKALLERNRSERVKDIEQTMAGTNGRKMREEQLASATHVLVEWKQLNEPGTILRIR